MISARRLAIRSGVLLLLGACAGGPESAPAPNTRPPSGVVDPPVADATPSLLDDRLPEPPTPRVHRPEPWPFDILHYDIHVRPDFERQSLSGAVTIRLRAREPGLRELPLDAVDFTDVVVQDARGGDVPFRQDADHIVLLPAEPFPVERDWSCTISWEVRPIGGAYFNGPTVAEPDAPRSVYTQGECEDTRLWMPCRDFPDDRASHAISLTLPDGMQAVAAGRRLEQQPGVRPGETTHRFRMDAPHVVYLTTFAAGDLEIQTAEGVTSLEYLCEARDRDLIAPSLRHTDAILRSFAEMTGRSYPYSKYAQVTVREFDFGGMENISATTLTDRTLHPLEWEPEKSSRGLVAHEAAHQWFGDLITCAHWAHIWLNEGFATYYEVLHRGVHEGRDGLLLGLRGARRSGLGAFDREPRPVVTFRYADPFDLFDGHAYGGGAARLHMLRDLLGEATFERLVRTYVRRFENGLVTTEDFEALASEVAGSDLSWWFDQWLRGAGYPRVQVRSTWAPDEGAVRLTVKQTQKTAKGVPAAFRLPLTVAFVLPDGREVRRRLNVRRRSQTFTVPLPDAPRRVRPDPDTVLLARFDEGRSVADLRFDLWTDPNPARRLDAAEELGRRSRNKKATAEDREAALAALLETVEVAPGHALYDFARNVAIPPIRRTVVTELGRSKDARSRAAVAALLASPPDLRVELAALRAAGSQGAPALAATRDALLAAARGGHELKRAAALRSLAKCRAEGAADLLLEALPTRGYQAVVRTAALDGLADLAAAGERDALLPHLLRHAGPEFELETRSAALRAVGRLGKGHAGPGSEVRAVVLEALRDPGRRQRKAAADAAKALAEPDLLPDLVAAFRAEPWRRTRRSMRGAVVAARKAAVQAGRGVSVESRRALELWSRYAELGTARAAPGADTAAVDAERKDIAKTLRELGVGLPPKPPAEGAGDASGE